MPQMERSIEVASQRRHLLDKCSSAGKKKTKSFQIEKICMLVLEFGEIKPFVEVDKRRDYKKKKKIFNILRVSGTGLASTEARATKMAATAKKTEDLLKSILVFDLVVWV